MRLEIRHLSLSKVGSECGRDFCAIHSTLWGRYILACTKTRPVPNTAESGKDEKITIDIVDVHHIDWIRGAVTDRRALCLNGYCTVRYTSPMSS